MQKTHSPMSKREREAFLNPRVMQSFRGKALPISETTKPHRTVKWEALDFAQPYPPGNWLTEKRNNIEVKLVHTRTQNRKNQLSSSGSLLQ